MRKITLFIAVLCAVSAMAYDGTRPGRFSVAADKQVVFSWANLIYLPGSGKWEYCSYQPDYRGEYNASLTSYSIDLFGYGTGDNPTLRTTQNADYATFVDWGINDIELRGTNRWRVLTSEEWNYLFFLRSNAANLFGLGTVNNGFVSHGLIVLPDNWETPEGLDFYRGSSKGLVCNDSCYTNSSKNNFSHNAYDADQWFQMENAGAIFLPAAGYRVGADVGGIGEEGRYWTSTPEDASYAYFFFFDAKEVGVRDQYRKVGAAVRLVQDVNTEAIDNTSAQEQIVKHIENGQLLIEKNGKTYNALGIETK